MTAAAPTPERRQNDIDIALLQQGHDYAKQALAEQRNINQSFAESNQKILQTLCEIKIELKPLLEMRQYWIRGLVGLFCVVSVAVLATVIK